MIFDEKENLEILYRGLLLLRHVQRATVPLIVRSHGTSADTCLFILSEDKLVKYGLIVQILFL